MASLSTHLTASTAAHGRFAFHPDCPRCTRERLAGSLERDVLVSRRTQAALAAGLLAFSAAAPAADAAASPPVEGDQEQEGLVALGGEELGAEPEFDPGGDDGFETDSGAEFGTPGAGGEEDTGEGAPVETEPVDDPNPPRIEAPEPAPPPAAEPPPAPPAPAPQPSPPPAAPPVPVAPPPLAAPPTPPPAAASVEELVEPEARAAAAGARGREQLTFTVPAQRPTERPAYQRPAPAAPTPGHAEPASALAAETAVAPGETTPVGQRTGGQGGVGRYVVRPGDSLWSIAQRGLGPGASAGRVARMVSRLWQLNSERIATGDPDLLKVGTELRMP